MIEWVPIAAGSATLGLSPAEATDHPDGALAVPRHTAWVEAFAITALPVSEWDWRAFCAATGAAAADGARGEAKTPYWDPVIGVSWDEAVAYCVHRGAALPSEAEWVRARGEGAFREPLTVSEYCADEFAPYPGADRYAFDQVRPPPGGWWGTRVRLDPSGRLRRGVNPTLRLDDTTFRVVKRIS